MSTKIKQRKPPSEIKESPELKRKGLTAAVELAMSHFREGMSEAQKSYILQREAKILAETGKVQDAVDVISHAINFNHVVIFFQMRATFHKTLMKWQEAYFDYSFAIRLEAENGSHYAQRGACLAKLKYLDMALEDLILACELEPIAQNFLTRATIYADLGDYENALEDLDIALEKDDSTNFELKLICSYRRAVVYYELAKYKDCVDDLQYVLQKDPNSVPPRILLGRAYKMLGGMLCDTR